MIGNRDYAITVLKKYNYFKKNLTCHLCNYKNRYGMVSTAKKIKDDVKYNKNLIKLSYNKNTFKTKIPENVFNNNLIGFSIIIVEFYLI